MVYEPLRDRLRVFVTSSAGDCGKEYFLDRRSGEWGIRDYSAYLTAGTNGLTGGCYDKHTDRAILLSSGGSFVFNQKSTNTDDEGTAIAAYRKSPILDQGQPDIIKRWDTMTLEAKAAIDGDALVVSVSIDGAAFSTVGTLSLTTAWTKYRIPLQNRGGYKIQTKIANSGGSTVEVRSIREPSLVPVREH